MPVSPLATISVPDMIFPRLFAGCILLASVSLLGSAEPLTYFLGSRKSVVSFRITPEGKTAIPVILNREPHVLILDTGATTVLDLGVAQRLGLHPVESPESATGLTGRVGKRWLARVNLQIGEIRITAYPISCLDLSELRSLNKENGEPVLDGLIGADLLATLRAQIDYRRKKLTVWKPRRR